MTRRTFLAALAAALSLALGAAPPRQPVPADRIVAIGDIHGSYDGFVAILKASGLVNDGGRWAGGKARLVQTGDYCDRGEKVRDVLDLLMRLEGEASRAGGRALVLFGNHEGMNLLHDFRDVSPATFAAFADSQSENRRKRAFKEYTQVLERRGGKPVSEQEWLASHPAGFFEYVEALSPRGKYGRWLRERKVVVNEGGTIFMHAGIAPELTGTLDDINRTARRELQQWDEMRATLTDAGIIRPFFTLQETLEAVVAEHERISAALKDKEPPGDHVTREFVAGLEAAVLITKSSLVAADGPLWFRGFAQWADEDEPKVTALLQRFEATRFVSAHTPMLPGRIRSRFNNRVFLIDTGMLSSYYKGGQPSALEIAGGKITAIYTTGREVLQEK